MFKQLLPAVVVMAAVAPGCNPVAGDNRSAVTIHAAFGGQEDEIGQVGFFSDVVNNLGDSEDDFFEVTVESVPKNPNATVSDLYTVEFEAYQVSFSRVDGKNEPGVDVPFPFTLALGGDVDPRGNTDLNLLFVTEEMKKAQPLRGLFFSANQRIYATLHVTIFGRDRVENRLSASASAPIIFGDF